MEPRRRVGQGDAPDTSGWRGRPSPTCGPPPKTKEVEEKEREWWEEVEKETEEWEEDKEEAGDESIENRVVLDHYLLVRVGDGDGGDVATPRIRRGPWK